MNERSSTILVIDDDPVIQQTLAALLAGAGYQLEFSAMGDEGLRLASELRPDVILLDVMLPGMDGYEVCRRLRSDPALAEAPIIMITALDDRPSRLKGFQAGADDFLSKPFDSLELQMRLQTLTRLNRYHRILDERRKLSEALAKLSEQNIKLRQLSQQLLEAQEMEHKRLAMELHDEVGQMLTGLKLILERDDRANGLDDCHACTQEALKVTDDLLHRVREISLDLRPAMLDDFGLFAALDGFFKRFNRQTHIQVFHNINPLAEQRFPRVIETTIYRVVQEALTNVARHTDASEVTVTLNIEANHLQLTVIDAGAGFDTNTILSGHSMGISGMRERVALAGGQFFVQSSSGEGTMICSEFTL